MRDRMVAKWKRDLFKQIKNSWDDEPKITFVHIPKTGGNTIGAWLDQQHNRLIKPRLFRKDNPNERIGKGYVEFDNVGVSCLHRSPGGISFTVIREPVARFESYLNFILDERCNIASLENKVASNSSESWGQWKEGNITLNEIIEILTPDDIPHRGQFRTLSYYTKNVDVLLIIDEVIPFFKSLGFKTKHKLPHLRNSAKTRGTLNEKSKAKIRQIFHEDVKLYEHWTRKDREEAG